MPQNAEYRSGTVVSSTGVCDPDIDGQIMTRSAVKTALMGSVIVALVLSTSVQAALFSSVLPASRSVQVGEPASFFATMINASNLSADGCRVELTSSIGATFTYQRTNEANEPVGSEGVPFSIAANENQSLVLSLTANSVVDPTDVEFTFSCDNHDPAPVYPGLNTLLFSASDQPTPDMVALSATLSGDGVSVVPPNNQLGLFSIASINLGSAATLTVQARATGVQPSVLVVCETDPQSGACLSSPAASAVSAVAANATPTYAVFFADAAAKIPFDPAGNRILLEFLDNGQIKGATSVAVRSSTATDLFVSEVSPDLVQPICLGCHFTGGDAGNTRLVFEANPNAEPPLLVANEQVFRTYIETVNDGVQVILSNAVGERGHSVTLSAE